jgi:hypothetical protein
VFDNIKLPPSGPKTFSVIPLYMQSLQVYLENCVRMYTIAYRRGLSSALL